LYGLLGARFNKRLEVDEVIGGVFELGYGIRKKNDICFFVPRNGITTERLRASQSTDVGARPALHM